VCDSRHVPSRSISRAAPARRSFCASRSAPISPSRNTAPALPAASASITKSSRPATRASSYYAITGYGHDGPYRDLVSHDLNYIATAGVLSILGRPGQLPTIPHNLIADYADGGNASMGPRSDERGNPENWREQTGVQPV